MRNWQEILNEIMNFLVTGAAGFIGYEVCMQLSNTGHNVIALDGLVEGLYGKTEKLSRFKNLERMHKVQTVELDLSRDDLSLLNNFEPIDIVIHLAAMPGLQKSWELFDQYVYSNIIATERLARFFTDKELTRFIHISTSSVYGKYANGDENSVLAPVSPYGVTKLAAEGLLNSYYASYGLPLVILRYFSVYGPGQRPDMAYRRFISSALKSEPLTIYGNGDQIRTNSYVSDIARWTANAARFAKSGDIVNLSGSRAVTINDVCQILENLLQKKLLYQYQTRPFGDQNETRGNIDLAKQLEIWDYETDIRVGLEAQIEWQKQVKLY